MPAGLGDAYRFDICCDDIIFAVIKRLLFYTRLMRHAIDLRHDRIN